jgi:hypothetical protein
MVNYIREEVEINHLDKYVLPYWLVNSSELLNFLKQDLHLSHISYDAQKLLADCVRTTFDYLMSILEQQLDCVLGSFFDPSDHIEEVNLNQALIDQSSQQHQDYELNLNDMRPTLNHVIQVLNQTMNLLRGVRLNAALTIQLFSKLFHYISMWLFNKLIRDQRSGLCSRYWGDKLIRRLTKIQMWSEKQGLELAADLHLQRITQAAFFLQASKYDVQSDLSKVSSVCYGLNSLQIKCLLKNYLQAPNEPPLSPELCNQLLIIAVNTQDRLLNLDGKQIQLEEEADLQLPFLLPEDGYSGDTIKGLPTGLLNFIEGLQNSGHCWLWQNTQGPGSWKKFMSKETMAITPNPVQVEPRPCDVTCPIEQASIEPAGPNIVKIKLNKKNNGLGLSIVAARGTNQIHSGIYIKSVVPTGAASDDGRLNAGDQLLAVDDVSLVNVTQERAAELMTKSGPVVCLTIGKDAAAYHDLDALLNKSPMSQGTATLEPRQFQNQTQTLHQSMMSLNNGQQQQQQQQQSSSFSGATLPRSHLDSVNNSQSQNDSYRNRSMSQEMLKSSEEVITASPVPKPTLRQFGVTSPTPPQFNYNQHQQYQHQPRGLPNEQQIRYGSERPAMSVSSSLQSQGPGVQQRSGLPNELIPRFGSERPSQMQQQHHHNHHNQQQQRFNGQQQQQQQQPVNGHDLSPSKSASNINRARQASLSELDEINYNQQQQQRQFEDLYGKVRPNIEQTPNPTLNANVNQQMYKTLPNNNSRNPNANNLSLNMNPINNMTNGNINNNHHQQHQNHHQNGIDERTKSQSQLYEQIWANNNNQNQNQTQNQQRLIQQHQHQQQQQFNKQNHFAASVDDLNLKNLEITNNHAHAYSQQQQLLLQKSGHPQIQLQNTNSQSHSNINQHLRKFDFIDNSTPTSTPTTTTTTNVIIPNSTQLTTATSHPNLNPNQINKVSRSNLTNNTNGSQSVRSIPMHHHHNHHNQLSRLVQENGEYPARNYENQVINATAASVAAKPMPPPVLAKPVIPNKPFNIQINQNKIPRPTPQQSESERIEEEQFRLLKQRLDMLAQLEQKGQRSLEEDSRMNKLRTEIEFDRRVLEMNSVSSQYLDETNDDNDIDYSPEVRERLSNQMRDDLIERRRLFDQIQSESKEQRDQEENRLRQNEIEQRELKEQAAAAAAVREMEENKKRRDEEQVQERVAEMKREEMRLKKHIDLNLRSSSTNLNNYHFTQQKAQLNGTCSPEPPSDMYLYSSRNNGSYSTTEIELVESTSCSNLLSVSGNRPQKHVQFVSEAEIMSPKMSQRFGSNGNSPEHSNEGSNGSTPPPPPPPPLPQPPPSSTTITTTPTKRVMFSDLDFESQNGHGPQTPSVIGANEVYVDQRLKMKQKQQEQQQLASMYMEGEKLSFKDKMKLFAKQSGELINDQADMKFKVSKKQREIESKFETK